VAKREDPHLVLRQHVPIEGDVSSVPVRDHKFPQFPLKPMAYQGMGCQSIYRRLYRHHRVDRGARILVTQKLKRAFDMIEGAC